MTTITCPHRHDPPKAVPGQPWVRGRDCPWCWHALARRNVVHTPEPNPTPLASYRLAGPRLAGGEPRDRYAGHSNAAVLNWRGRLLCAYRHKWYGSDVWLTELNPDTYEPLGPGERLVLEHPLASHGREDPRLMEHDGQPVLWFVGVSGQLGPCSQLYAPLGERLRPSKVYCPGPRRGVKIGAWEKNWTPFVLDGVQYAVKSISPRHVVVRIDGNKAAVVADVPGPTWTGGPLRGGAAPVRHGDQYLSWFHGHVKWAGRKTYTAGLYSFEAKLPFRPLRITPAPVVYGDSRTRPRDWYINNFFPCGALLERGTWVVSAGVHDRWVSVTEWDAADVCRKMMPVSRHAVPASKRGCGC